MSLRRPILVLAPAAALVAGIALFTNVLPFRQIYEQRQEIAAAADRLAALEASNEALEAHVAALQTPLEVERLAREQLGYVRPGEKAYVVIDPPDPSPAEAVAGPAADADDTGGSLDERAWFERLWDFVTGRDVAAAG